MSDIPVRLVPHKTSETLAFYFGHYAAAVAEALLEQGLPVHGILAAGPHTEPIGDGPEQFWEGGASIEFSTAFTRAVSTGPELVLEWDAQSGWSLCPHPDDDKDLYADARWLADGLTPAPDRVVAFVLAAQVDLRGAGSGSRPYYRRQDDSYSPLAKTLKAYLPTGPQDLLRRTWRLRFDLAQDAAYQRRVVNELTTPGADPVVDFPLRRSEIRALVRLLDLVEARAHETGKLAAALADDLTRRGAAEPESAQLYREAGRAAAQIKARRQP